MVGFLMDFHLFVFYAHIQSLYFYPKMLIGMRYSLIIHLIHKKDISD